MSTLPFRERLQQLLEQSGIEGAILLIAREKDESGKVTTTYKFALNGVTEQEAIGEILACLADMLLADSKKKKRPRDFPG